MAVKRDEQGRLVLVSMVDGEEVVTKVIPKHEEQLYLRRGVTGMDANKDFPAKAEAVKVQEMERPYDVHRSWAGGDVQTFDEVVKDLPDHPECREHEYLREPIVQVGGQEDDDDLDYTLIGVNLDPGEDPSEEPIEPQA